MKKNNRYAFSIFTIILGIVVLAYPFLAKIIELKHQTYIINKYNETIEKMSDEDIKIQKDKMQQFNNDIISNTKTIDLFTIGTILGYIDISKINVHLPIYEGTDSNTLDKGVGHFENSTFPTKFGDYHAVFMGHTGISTKKIFDDLDKLNVNDEFTINFLDEKYNYKIYEVKKIHPILTNELEIKKNKKLVTLITCTPKYINTHRLLIMGELISN